jgi:hypothetical protein
MNARPFRWPSYSKPSDAPPPWTPKPVPPPPVSRPCAAGSWGAGGQHETSPMNASTDACLVEQRGMAVLLPFLESRAWRGQVIRVAKGPLATHFQRSFGDRLIATGPGNVASVEIKSQRRWTGNLFLEVWSNKNLDDRGSHITRQAGSTIFPGGSSGDTCNGTIAGGASCRSRDVGARGRHEASRTATGGVMGIISAACRHRPGYAWPVIQFTALVGCQAQFLRTRYLPETWPLRFAGRSFRWGGTAPIAASTSCIVTAHLICKALRVPRIPLRSILGGSADGSLHDFSSWRLCRFDHSRT